ncbi:MAG TPA: hypothetical protein VGE95_08935, partial [Arthrobacter sp.]
AAVIREQAEQVLTKPDDGDSDDTASGSSSDVELRKAVDQRARQLADDLKQSRIPRQQLLRTLTEAFADPDDPTVYKALLRWMRTRNR